MANDNICVFCGEKLSLFHSASIICADIHQPSCKNCAKELKELSEEERCRRALRLGLANSPEQLEERIELITKAEDHRPTCPQCGTKLTFGQIQQLDNSPMRDGIFSDTFDVQPAFCESCGKMELYHPYYANKNTFIAYLIKKDTNR